MERIIRFEAEGFSHHLGDVYPGRDLAEHLASRLTACATVVSGPEERDHGWDIWCQYEGRRVWVLVQQWPPDWGVRIGWTNDWGAELRDLFTWGRRRRRMREWFERLCRHVEEILQSDPRVRAVRQQAS